MMERKDQQPSNQSSSLHKTIDYDPVRDVHLQRFFRLPFMQEHMRHAAALDRISARRNPWNDAVEYLMEAGSAYNVKGIFQQQQGGEGGDRPSSSSTVRTSNMAGSHHNNKNKKQPLRPQPPSSANNNNNNSSRRPQHHQNINNNTNASPESSSTRRMSLAQMNEKYRNTPGRTLSHNNNNNNNNNNTGRHNEMKQSVRSKQPPALPRYSAALRNIRRFDDEVSRILAEGKQTDVDKKDNDRWKRMQQRRKMEQMIHSANSPKFGRHNNNEDDNENMKNNENDDDQEDNETYRLHQHHSRPRSLAIKHLLAGKHNRDNNKNTDEEYHIYNDDEENNHGRNNNNKYDDDECDDDDDEASRIPGWVSYALSRFQANCIGWVVRNKLQRTREAVIKIQRTFKEHLANRGASLALRIIQKAGRAMKFRRRLFLVGERHRIWKRASEEHKMITAACLNLHYTTSLAAKLPVIEAANREAVEEEHQQSMEENHLELIASDLKRRALLTCVTTKGKLGKESTGRLLDDDDEEPAGERASAMKPMDTPSVLVPALKEQIEEEEPSPRHSSESPRTSPENVNNARKKSTSPIRKDELVAAAVEEEQRKVDANDEQESQQQQQQQPSSSSVLDDSVVPVSVPVHDEEQVLHEEEQSRKEEDIAVGDTTIVPVNDDDVEEL